MFFITQLDDDCYSDLTSNGICVYQMNVNQYRLFSEDSYHPDISGWEEKFDLSSPQDLRRLADVLEQSSNALQR